MNTLSLNALLLVDGYNIIGSWTNLKQTRDRHGLAMARQELVESLIGFSSHQGYQTQVIFDSQYQKTPSSQEHYGPHLSAGKTLTSTVNCGHLRSRSTIDGLGLRSRMDVRQQPGPESFFQ